MRIFNFGSLLPPWKRNPTEGQVDLTKDPEDGFCESGKFLFIYLFNFWSKFQNGLARVGSKRVRGRRATSRVPGVTDYP